MVTFDGASSSPSSAVAEVVESEYQVFLSFRGEDTRKTFTDHLYCYLIDAEIRTFRDNEELRVGIEIRSDLLRAIEESTISIPIISKGYASSKWCLTELTHMLKCKKNTGQPEVYPIFYDATPSDCKHHDKGCFAEAFLKHSKKIDDDTVLEWKEALREVAELRGWEKDKIADGHEGQLVKAVASDIFMKLKKNNVEITDKLVGMGHHMEAMKQLMDINSNDDVRVVGIHGMGGIGKTTIAKFVFNELGSTHFQQQCSFLEDIREKVKNPTYYTDLRNQLISDILKRKPDGIDFKRAFKKKRVLIVVDDIGEKSQLQKIIGSSEHFGSGSRIIVTTRDKRVFDELEGVLWIYKPKKMNEEDSLLLFCKHAFKSTQPWEGFEDISRQVVATTAGLPLSLVVTGSLLFAKEKTTWEATLKELTILPADEVKKSLKISYDTLSYGQKHIFLDIACHFTGEDATRASYMWEDCGFLPERGIRTLIYLSLITIGEDNVIRMHDHLRDLGRDIVYQENPSDPGQRSRLWSPKDAERVLRSKSGTRKVETLYMTSTSGWGSLSISNENLKGLSNLRYLHLELEGSGGLKVDFEELASNLRMFRCSFKDSESRLLSLGSRFSRFRNRLRTPITNFCANNLVVLDLRRSDISNGWESLIQIKAAANLKVLNLSRCRNLTKLPECLWNLKTLVELDLSDTGITELSERDIGNLTNLTKLRLRHSEIKRLPEGIGKLEKLQELDCYGCRRLEGAVPNGIGRLSSLRVLDLSYTGITELSERGIGNLTNLTKLRLQHSEIKRLPEGIRKLEKLQELDCFRCRRLEGAVPNGIGGLSSLRDLSLYDTRVDMSPDDVGNLTNLTNCKILFLSQNIQLPPAQGLEFPLTITKLGIPLTEASLDSLRRLVNLRVLEFYRNSSGHCCEPVVGLGVVLEVNHSKGKNNPPFIDMPRNLVDLSLRGFDEHMKSCRLLQAMKFDSSSRLTYLGIRDYEGVRSPVLSSLDLSSCQMLNLYQLLFWECPWMREIADLGNSLGSTWEDIFISDCASLEVIWDLSGMTSLRKLFIMDCPKLREIKGLEVLTSFEELTVRRCPLLNIDQLPNCKSLEIDEY